MILQQTWEFPKRGNVSLGLTDLLTPWAASLIEGQVPRLGHWISWNSFHILKAKANDVLSKDLLCSHVYVVGSVRLWGQGGCKWKQYCALYWRQ